MNLEEVDSSFRDLIMQPRIHHKLEMRAGAVMQLRYRLRQGSRIRLDLKIRLLQKAGIPLQHHRWTDRDVIGAIQVAIKAGAAAKQLGPEYLFEKWRRQSLSFPSP